MPRNFAKTGTNLTNLILSYQQVLGRHGFFLIFPYLQVTLQKFHVPLVHSTQTPVERVYMTVQCVRLENTVLKNPSLRLVIVIKASTAQQTSQMESQACVLVPMDQYRNPAPREHSSMRQEGGLLRIVKSALQAIIVQSDLRRPQFVKQVTTVHLGQATLNHVLWEHSITAAGLITLRTVPHAHLAGKDMYYLYKIICRILYNAQCICHKGYGHARFSVLCRKEMFI